MELLQLQYFRELARNPHLSKTAEKLHIAQPSLSQMLKKLETEVGTPLFDRVGKRIVLNSSGKIFLKYVDEIFGALDNAALELETDQIRKQKTVALHICSASMLLPEIVRRIQIADPDIRLQIFQCAAKEKPAVPSLYLTSSPVCPERNESSVVLMEEKLMAALPREHPLSKRDILTWEELKSESFLSLAPESNLSVIIRYFCESKGIETNITTYVDTPAVLRDLLRMNLGIAFIPERTWKGFAADTVVLRPVKDLQMERYLVLSWDEKIYQTLPWKLCKKIIMEYFREQAADEIKL